MKKQDFTIYQGRTFTASVRWEVLPFIYKPITGITKAAPVNINAPSHGLTPGWRVAVVSAQGMVEINAAKTPPKDPTDYHAVTVVDPDHVTLNDVNSADFTTHVPSTGYLQFYTPADLNGVTCRMKVKDKVEGTTLLDLSTGTGEIGVSLLNNVITITISATVTAALAVTKAVYDLEAENSGGVVTPLAYGNIAVKKEITD